MNKDFLVHFLKFISIVNLLFETSICLICNYTNSWIQVCKSVFMNKNNSFNSYYWHKLLELPTPGFCRKLSILIVAKLTDGIWIELLKIGLAIIRRETGFERICLSPFSAPHQVDTCIYHEQSKILKVMSTLATSCIIISNYHQK